MGENAEVEFTAGAFRFLTGRSWNSSLWTLMNGKNDLTASGRCLCGGVRYEVRGPLRGIVECHCKTCRRFSGGLWHATAAAREAIAIQDNGSLKWYRSSERVRRGFCGNCGSSLFWDRDGLTFLGIAAGTLDDPTNLTMMARLFLAHGADYYASTGQLPEYREYPDDPSLLKIPDE